MRVLVATLGCCGAPRKPSIPFYTDYVNDFGLQICERATGSSTATASVARRFSEVLKKEGIFVEMERDTSVRAKYFEQRRRLACIANLLGKYSLTMVAAETRYRRYKTSRR